MRTKLCVLFLLPLVPIGTYAVVLAERRTRVTRLACGLSVQSLLVRHGGEMRRGLRGRVVHECGRVVRE